MTRCTIITAIVGLMAITAAPAVCGGVLQDRRCSAGLRGEARCCGRRRHARWGCWRPRGGRACGNTRESRGGPVNRVGPR